MKTLIVDKILARMLLVIAGVVLNSGITVTGTLTINGTSATSRTLVSGYPLGTAQTITNNGTNSITNADFQDITGAGTASWDLSAITGLSGDCEGNSGITFTPSATQTWQNANGGTWSVTANWSSRVPLCQDDANMGVTYNASKTVYSSG